MNEEGGLWNRALVKRVAIDTEQGLHASQDPELWVLPGSLGKSQVLRMPWAPGGLPGAAVLVSPWLVRRQVCCSLAVLSSCWTSPLALAGPHLPLSPHIPEAPLELTPPTLSCSQPRGSPPRIIHKTRLPSCPEAGPCYPFWPHHPGLDSARRLRRPCLEHLLSTCPPVPSRGRSQFPATRWLQGGDQDHITLGHAH